jgi:hypothetical protein
MLRSWSAVGGAVVISSWNSPRFDATVSASAAAEACLRMLRTRVDEGTDGEWKSVIGSRVLACAVC